MRSRFAQTAAWFAAASLLVALILPGCRTCDGQPTPDGVNEPKLLESIDRATFWQLIEDTRSAGPGEAHVQAIQARLAVSDPKAIVEFQQHLDTLMAESYGYDLWGACYLALGGCSDDGFEYFRLWLVAQGRDVFEKVVANPDALAELPRPDELESLMYVAPNAYEQRTGQPLPDEAYARPKYPDLGQGWDFDDDAEMQRRYPALTKKYP